MLREKHRQLREPALNAVERALSRVAPNARLATSRTTQLASAVEIFALPLTSLAIVSIVIWLLKTAKMHQIDKAQKTKVVTMRPWLAQLLKAKLA